MDVIIYIYMCIGVMFICKVNNRNDDNGKVYSSSANLYQDHLQTTYIDGICKLEMM
jgi:hypothetical protein